MEADLQFCLLHRYFGAKVTFSWHKNDGLCSSNFQIYSGSASRATLITFSWQDFCSQNPTSFHQSFSETTFDLGLAWSVSKWFPFGCFKSLQFLTKYPDLFSVNCCGCSGYPSKLDIGPDPPTTPKHVSNPSLTSASKKKEDGPPRSTQCFADAMALGLGWSEKAKQAWSSWCVSCFFRLGFRYESCLWIFKGDSAFAFCKFLFHTYSYILYILSEQIMRLSQKWQHFKG